MYQSRSLFLEMQSIECQMVSHKILRGDESQVHQVRKMQIMLQQMHLMEILEQADGEIIIKCQLGYVTTSEMEILNVSLAILSTEVLHNLQIGIGMDTLQETGLLKGQIMVQRGPFLIRKPIKL